MIESPLTPDPSPTRGEGRIFPALSVVVIGRNEGERLTRCLESVRAMADPGGPVELIYVDSASTDGSPERAAALGAAVIVVHPERPSAALGRNAGWRAARAPLVLFLDGDTLLHPRFVIDSLPEFQNPKVVVVWGHRREIRPEASLYNRVLDLDWVYPPGPSEFCGGDALMRCEALEAVDGFDATLIAGEEPDLCRRLRARGGLILHVDRPMTGHDLAMTRWRQYWRRAVRAGHAYAEVAERFRATDTPLWERELKRNRVHAGVLLLSLPVAVAGLLRGGLAIPLLVLGLWLALALRTALKVGWKSRDPLTRLLYGLHSHVQQIPILIGQLGYYRDRWRGRRRGLIEYK
ncbi:MAG: glycosyltransferase [Candidatus Competibacter sp.]|nr:glycosyltransferase [Candidatus Competibacter sp.]MDG4583306.1 glycosyltransferase [Candidatus Competibacter sp.]